MTSESALHRFALRRAEAADVLDGLATTAQGAGGEAGLVEHLRGTAARARAGRFVVLLVGCFSSGKSTLLNALLGQPVLPVKVNPCTAILTELVFGEVPSVEVRFLDGTSETLTPEVFIERYQLETASLDDAGAEAKDRFGRVDRAVVSWPLPLLRDGVVLIDTPGLDDDEARTQRTLASLPEADAVIFVLNATRFLTDLERRTVRRELLPLGLTNLFFPVTMVDLLDALSDAPERDLRDVHARARETLGPLCLVDGVDRLDERFFPVNARGGLHARWDRGLGSRRAEVDVHALSQTGLVAFEESLERFLVDERGRAQMLNLLHQARRAADSLGRQAALDRATAAASVEELRARQQALAPRFAELDQIADRVADTVDAFVDRQKVRTWQSLRDALARAEDELETAIGGFDLGSVAGLDLLTPRGREKVERAMQTALEAWLDDCIAKWQASLQTQMETALDGLRIELAGQARDFDDLARGIVTDFAGESVQVPLTQALGEEPDPVERWFAVALGAVLLSPGTMAAGWTQGYSGALKGAASRLAVRLAIFAVGVLLGPVGWAGLALYAVSDAALLVLTGGGQLRRMRRQVAQNLRGKLVAQADEVRDQVQERVAEGLGPIRDGLVGAARGEATDLHAVLEQTIVARDEAARDAASREAQWIESLAKVELGVQQLSAWAGP
ncbi:MAG: dynamin family protein [Myxococcota bacterium]